MALPRWEIMRKKYRCRRPPARGLKPVKQKLGRFSFGVAAALMRPFRCLGAGSLWLFFVIWLAWKAPVGEAAPINPRMMADDEADYQAARPQVQVFDSISHFVQEKLASIENLVILPATAAVLAFYLIAAVCLAVKAKSLKRSLMHVMGTKDAEMATRPYIITMSTGLAPGSGTRAQVLMRVTGSCAASPVVNISRIARSMKLANPARRAAGSSLTMWLADDIGLPKHVEVKLHKTQKNSAWFLKQVTVTDTQAKQLHVACVNSWIEGKEPHKFQLSAPENVSRWSLLRASLTRAFSGFYIWTFWCCTSSLSTQASLCMCTTLVLAYMVGASVYLTMVVNEIVVPTSQHFDISTGTLKRLFVEKVAALQPYLKFDYMVDIIGFTVTCAAVTWILELVARYVKQPKNKEICDENNCTASGAYVSDMEEVIEVDSISQDATTLNVQQLVQSRMKDLLHDASVYVRFSQSDTEPHHSSQQGSNASLWRNTSSLVQTPPRKFPRCTSTSHVDMSEQKYKCAACSVKSCKEDHDVNDDAPYDVVNAAKDIVKIIAENFPIVDGTTGGLRKKIRDRISMIYGCFPSSQKLEIEKAAQPIKQTVSDGKLIEKSHEEQAVQGHNSDITCDNTSGETTKNPSTVLSDFINKTVKASVTSSAKQVLGFLMNNKATTGNNGSDKKVITKSASKLPRSTLSVSDVKKVLTASMSALQGTTDTKMTQQAVNAAIKMASTLTADKIVATLTDTLASSPSSSTEDVKLSTEIMENMMNKVQAVLRDQQALIGPVKDGLHAQIYAQQFCETIMANAYIRAKFMLTFGNDIPTERLLTTCKNLVRDSKGKMGEEMATKMKKAMKTKAVKKEIVAAAVQRMLDDLEEQAGVNSQGEVGCCCDVINKVYTLTMEDNLGVMDASTMVGALADDLVRSLCGDACSHVMRMLATLMTDQEGIQILATMPDLQATDTVNQVVTSPAQLMARALLKAQQPHKVDGVPIDSASSSLSTSGSQSGSTTWLNKNQNCVVDMSTSATCPPALKTAGCPPTPAMSDRDLLELEEGLAAHSQGCLPSCCAGLLYALLGVLMLAAVVTIVLFGTGLSSLQATAWLVYVITALAMHVVVLEPIKVFVIMACNKRIYI